MSLFFPEANSGCVSSLATRIPDLQNGLHTLYSTLVHWLSHPFPGLRLHLSTDEFRVIFQTRTPEFQIARLLQEFPLSLPMNISN